MVIALRTSIHHIREANITLIHSTIPTQSICKNHTYPHRIDNPIYTSAECLCPLVPPTPNPRKSIAYLLSTALPAI